jgi:hypothetical protein
VSRTGCGAGPVVAEHGPQLVGRGGAGADLVLAEPDQGQQPPQAGVGGFSGGQRQEELRRGR